VKGQRHAPAAFYPRERPSTHCARGWVGPRAGLDRCGKSRSHRDSSPDRPAHSQSLYLLSYPARSHDTLIMPIRTTVNRLFTQRVSLTTQIVKDIFNAEPGANLYSESNDDMECQFMQIFIRTHVWEVATCLGNFCVRKLFITTSLLSNIIAYVIILPATGRNLSCDSYCI
jgi:hypothetical protein